MRFSDEASGVAVALYIDADNQPAYCAKPLVALCRADFSAQIIQATVAGNNLGQQIDGWREALLAEQPDLAIQALPVPPRKDSADIALLMALGADLEGHLRDQVLVIMVSRDDLLIGAAEHAKARGCKTLIAYADSDLQTARHSQLTTLLLPVPNKPTAAATPAPKVPSTSAPPSPQAQGDVQALLHELRSLCQPQPGGGYPAGIVGHALAKLGYDKAARTRLLTTTPGIRKQGSGASLTYLF
ncbi:MAG: NYN domain-containing protein [Chromatiaceae bacterium]|nr:NYN domain-containing protein [Chromatiaceae bacterium]MCF8016286.1 NYN domain-containing protein [Chromatiaceae bacterium]